MTGYNCYGTSGYFKCLNLSFYLVLLAPNFRFSSLAATNDNLFVSKEIQQNGQSWVFPDEKGMNKDQIDQVL